VLQGGTAVTLCDYCPFANGATWIDDESIVLSTSLQNSPALVGISSQGEQKRITEEAEKSKSDYAVPQILPGGDALLYTVFNPGPGPSESHLAVRSMKNG
jgi:hypothetical protein